MAESIESLRRSTLEVVDLPIDSIDPDPANPNDVPPELMRALRRSVEYDGFVQPIVVRPTEDGRYTITDGEHRWIVLRDAGSPTVPAVIDDAGEDDGRMRLLTMNGLRGKPNPVRQARVLAYLADQLGEAELRERLGMGEDEYEASVALKDVGTDLDDRLVAALEAEEASAPEVLRWRMGPRQAQTVERAIDGLVEDGAASRADALLTILNG